MVCPIWDLILASRGFIRTKQIIQDGNYKGKSKVSRHKDKKNIKNPPVEKDKIVLLVNQAWNASFARVEYNKKAIAAQGWNPLTFNLLNNPKIHGTMTEEDQQREQPTSIDDSDSPPNDHSLLPSSVELDSWNGWVSNGRHPSICQSKCHPSKNYQEPEDWGACNKSSI